MKPRLLASLDGKPFPGWAGETPYFLVINPGPANEPVTASWIVDLDEPGWMRARPKRMNLMRVEAEWLLVAKRSGTGLDGFPVLAMRILPGEQPYYTKRHVGIAYPAGGETMLYGIGKKRLDGHVDRLWVLPNGIIVPGDDGELFAVRMLKEQAAQSA